MTQQIQTIQEENHNLKQQNQLILEENQNLKQQNQLLLEEKSIANVQVEFLEEEKQLLINENINFQLKCQKLITENTSLHHTNQLLFQANDHFKIQNGYYYSRIQELEYQIHSSRSPSQFSFKQIGNCKASNIEEIESSVVFFGNSSSGKTSVIHHICEGKFNQNLKQTIGTTFTVHRIEINFQSIKLQIWDLPGEDRYRAILPSLHLNSSIGVFVFDSADSSSLNSMSQWMNEIQSTNHVQIHFIIVENKLDLIKENKFIRKEITEYKKNVQIDYCGVSAKNWKRN